jgi:hypothetical protein
VAAGVKALSAAELRRALRLYGELGADEVLLTPTTWNPDELSRVADALG